MVGNSKHYLQNRERYALRNDSEMDQRLILQERLPARMGKLAIDSLPTFNGF